jgi:hypothetical protein
MTIFQQRQSFTLALHLTIIKVYLNPSGQPNSFDADPLNGEDQDNSSARR